jgi:hypothetical protein
MKAAIRISTSPQKPADAKVNHWLVSLARISLPTSPLASSETDPKAAVRRRATRKPDSFGSLNACAQKAAVDRDISTPSRQLQAKPALL